MKFISKALLIMGLMGASLGGFLLVIYIFDSIWLAFFVGGALLLTAIAVSGKREEYKQEAED